MDNNTFRLQQIEDPVLDNQTFNKMLQSIDPASSLGFADMVAKAQAPYQNLLPLMTGQSTFGPAPLQPRTTIGKKITAAAALENVTGRAVWNIDRYVINPLFEESKNGTIKFYDKETNSLTTNFNIHKYIKDNQADLDATADGKVILNNYSLGYYDNVNSDDFFRAVGYDIIEAQLRNDLNTSTGDATLDLTGSLIGSAIDPLTLYGGRGVVAAGGFAKNYAFLKNAEQAFAKTAAYRRLIQTSKLGAGQFIKEEAKQGLGAAIFSQTALQYLDEERELDNFATDVATMTLGQIILSSLLRGATGGFNGKGRTSAEIDGILKRWEQAKNNIENGIKSDLKKTEVGDWAYADIEEARIAYEAQNTTPDSSINTAKADFDKTVSEGSIDKNAVSSEDVYNVNSLLNDIRTSAEGDAEVAALANDISNRIAPDGNASLSLDDTVKSILDELPALRERGYAGVADMIDKALAPYKEIAEFRAKQAAAKAKVEGVFSAEERALLKDILDNQNAVRETPIDTEAAIKQLEAIRNRGTQLFNYGRLDAMGLRTVKIDQPVEVIAERLIDAGKDLTLENALSELKRLSPAEQADLYASKADTKVTLDALTDILGSREEAAKVMSDAGEEAVKRNLVADNKGLFKSAFTAGGEPLKPTASRSLRSKIADANDYLPDRSNDVINKYVVKVRQALDKMFPNATKTAARIPVLGRFIGGDNINAEVMGQFAFHDMFSIRRLQLNDNPIIAAIANTVYDRILPMKGQTKGTIATKFSVEKLNKIAQGRTKATQSILLHEFEVFQNAAGNQFNFKDAASMKFDQFQWQSQQWLQQYEAWGNIIERLRITNYLNDKLAPGAAITLIDMDKISTEAAKLIKDFWPGEFKPEMVDAVVKNIETLKETGLLSQTADGKFTKWMTADQRNILKGVTSIAINPENLTLDQLDDLFVTLFRQDMQTNLFQLLRNPDYIVDGVGREWKGLDIFVDIEERDLDTGQIIKKYGIITRDEILAAAQDPAKGKELVNKIVEEFNNKWGGLVPIDTLAQARRYFEDLGYGQNKATINFNINRTLTNTQKFLGKYELATQLAQRLREFEALEIKRIYSPEDQAAILAGGKQVETVFTPLIRQYESMSSRLRGAIRQSSGVLTPDLQTLTVSTPKTFHYYTQFNNDALDKLVDFASEYGDRLGINVDKSRADISILRQHIKEQFGLIDTPRPSPVGKFAVDTTRNFVLGNVGFAQLIDWVGKGLGTTIAYADVTGTKSIANGIEGLIFSAKKTGMQADDLGFVAETLQTHLEDVAQIASQRLTAADGTELYQVGGSSFLEKFSQSHRYAIGKLSLLEAINDTTKLTNITTAMQILGGKKGVGGGVDLAAQTIRMMRAEGISAAQASTKIAKTAGMSNAVGFIKRSAADLGQDVNTFNLVSKIMANMSHDDILSLDELLKSVDYKDVKAHSTLGVQKVIFSTPEGKGLSDIQQNLLRKYGTLVDYWVEAELANIPSGSSNLLISAPQGFLNSAMTMFLKPTIQALNGMGIAQANVHIGQRAFFMVYMTMVAFGVQALKAASQGGAAYERWQSKIDEGGTGYVKLLQEALDYSGYLGIAFSKLGGQGIDMLSDNAFDRSSAGEFQIMSPVQSTYLQMSRGLGGALISTAKGDDLTPSQRNALRKYLALNIFETTAGGFIKRGINKVVDEGVLGDTVSEKLEFVFPTPQGAR